MSRCRVAIVGGVFQNVEILYLTVMRNNIRVEGRFMFDRIHADKGDRVARVKGIGLR